MIESDSLSLLRECDAGVKTAVASIDAIIPRAESENLKNVLTIGKKEHKDFEKRLGDELEKRGGSEKEPNPVIKAMARVKIEAETAFKPSDAKAANLITDGCAMGAKTLNRYINQYSGADEISKRLASELVGLEERLEQGVRPYL